MLSVLLCILYLVSSECRVFAREKHPARAKASVTKSSKSSRLKPAKNTGHNLKTSRKATVKTAQKRTKSSFSKTSRSVVYKKKQGIQKKHAVAAISKRKKHERRVHAASRHHYRFTAFRKPVSGQFHYTSSNYMEQKLQDKMETYIGIPYRSGGESRRGMDCSGFSRTLYANLFGIELPHSSAEQFEFSKLHTVDEDALKTGDLLFFSRRKRINHVGVYLGDGNFIHATNGSGITVSSLNDELWKSQIVAAKRPMSFDKNGATEAFQLQGAFHIPFRGGKVSSYTHDEFHPADGPPVQLAMASNNDVYRFDSGHLYSYELEYSQKIWNDNSDVRLSAIREKFDKSTSWNVYDRTMEMDWPVMLLDNRNDAFIRHGFKVAGCISPFEGFSITPSFTLLDYLQPHVRDTMEVPARIFGLDTRMTPLSGPWSVFMAVHYADQQDLAKSPFDTVSNGFNTSDMSFKLAYFFTNNVELSLMGRHDFNSIPAAGDASSSGIIPVKNDVMLKFDMKY